MSLILNGTTGISDVDGTAAAPALTGTDSNTGIFFPAADTIAFTEGGVEAMRIDSSGNVGIGTSSPLFALDVNGSARIGTTKFDSASLEVGAFGTGDRVSFVDFVSSGAPSTVDFSARVIRSSGANGSFELVNTGTGPMLFATNATERARIDSNGRIQVNGTTVVDVARISVSFDSANSTGIGLIATNASGGTLMKYLNSGSTQVGAITTNASTTTYGTTSDYRLKEDIAPMTGALAAVAALKPVTYKWKSTGEATHGFIAHELQAVVPECVVGEKDAVAEEQYEVTPAVKDADGNTITEAVMGTRMAPQYQGIDTSFLVATLTAAIQEQQALITALTTRITALEAI